MFERAKHIKDEEESTNNKPAGTIWYLPVCVQLRAVVCESVIRRAFGYLDIFEK